MSMFYPKRYTSSTWMPSTGQVVRRDENIGKILETPHIDGYSYNRDGCVSYPGTLFPHTKHSGLAFTLGFMSTTNASPSFTTPKLIALLTNEIVNW
ncbi:hypothetical protein [Candidatus Kuenenia stuttgartiensis]|nr:hypothetical protein [Candidatus Kuenenia stuttgartiensis]